MIQKHAILFQSLTIILESSHHANHEGLVTVTKVHLCILEEEIDRYAQEQKQIAQGVCLPKTYRFMSWTTKVKKCVLPKRLSVPNSSGPVYGLVDWLWCGANHFHWYLWVLMIQENAFLVLFALCKTRGPATYVARLLVMEVQIEAIYCCEQDLGTTGRFLTRVMTQSTDGFTEKRLSCLS